MRSTNPRVDPQGKPATSPRVRGRLEAVAGPGLLPSLAEERRLPVLPALEQLLGGRGLRRGSTVAVRGSVSMALALVAGASAAGSWVAAVGLPDLGVVAATEVGMVLDRLALVPAPGAATWAAVVATLLDAVDAVLVRPPAVARATEARRLVARARQRGAVLIPIGAWEEQADLRLAVTSSEWRGLARGYGRLEGRLAEVVATGRGAAALPRHATLWLPGPDGAIAPAGLVGYATPPAKAAGPPSAGPARSPVEGAGSPTTVAADDRLSGTG